jgi:hypothetical protein
VATAWGLFHNLDSCPLLIFIACISREVQTCVCSPFVTWDSSDRWGQLCLAWELGCFSGEASIARCYGARRSGKLLPIAYERYKGPVRVVQMHGHECTISGLATRNQVGRHGLYPRHYSGVFVAPRAHETQKSSIGQGLYPILLLALLALTTSAYSSLGFSQELYP